jgi:hypothetical protein
VDTSSGFFFPTGTDLGPGSVANQASNFMNLVGQVTPTLQSGNSTPSGSAATRALIDCLVLNECLVDPVLPKLFRCIAGPACKDQYNDAVEEVKGFVDEIASCYQPMVNTTESGTGAVTSEQFADLSEDGQLSIILCLLSKLFPSASDIVKEVAGIVEDLFGVAMVVVDILANGLPGEVILWFFGWAVVEDGELVAPYKWYPCVTAAAVFLVGIEVFKLFALRYVVWTKR